MKDFFRRVNAQLQEMGIPQIKIYASYASFFVVLSVFPLLVLLISILRYTGLEISNLTEILDGVIPKVLMPTVEKLIRNTYKGSTGTIVSVSAVTALWSASRGVYGLCMGLNNIYKADPTRYIRLRLLSVVYTFSFLLVLLLTLVLHVFGESILPLLPKLPGPLEDVLDLRIFFLLGTQTVLFTAMYKVFPSRKVRIVDCVPGALLASIGWLLFSHIYSLYVELFPSMAIVFGSVYAVAMSLLWLYCCISILFYGAALNRWLMERRKK